MWSLNYSGVVHMVLCADWFHIPSLSNGLDALCCVFEGYMTLPFTKSPRVWRELTKVPGGHCLHTIIQLVLELAA